VAFSVSVIVVDSACRQVFLFKNTGSDDIFHMKSLEI